MTRSGQGSSGQDLLSTQAARVLDAWDPQDQEQFQEILEDAATDLQRELIRRSLVARHPLAELHAFADEIRGMDDHAVYEACTPHVGAVSGRDIVARLLAEADPLAAFVAGGHALSPRQPTRPAFSLTAALVGQMPPPLSIPRRPDSATLDQGPQARFGHGPQAAPGRSVLDDLFNEALRGLGLSYREHPLGQATSALASLLPEVRRALGEGLPVPLVLGADAGDRQAFGLLLQLDARSRTVAYQLYEPVSGDLAWVHEADLLAGAELPLSNKSLRRIVLLALPSRRP